MDDGEINLEKKSCCSPKLNKKNKMIIKTLSWQSQRVNLFFFREILDFFFLALNISTLPIFFKNKFNKKLIHNVHGHERERIKSKSTKY